MRVLTICLLADVLSWRQTSVPCKATCAEHECPLKPSHLLLWETSGMLKALFGARAKSGLVLRHPASEGLPGLISLHIAHD